MVSRSRQAASFALTAIAVLGTSSPAAAEPGAELLPSVAQVQSVFPLVTEEDYDGDDGNPVSLPSCAGVTYPSTPPTVFNRFGSFSWDGRDKRDAVPGSQLYTFRNTRQAKATMRVLRAVVRDCLGYREDVDTYSRYRLIAAPKIGDESLGYEGTWQTTFESRYPKYQDIWVRDGSTIVVASVSLTKGDLPTRKTKRLARIVLKAAQG